MIPLIPLPDVQVAVGPSSFQWFPPPCGAGGTPSPEPAGALAPPPCSFLPRERSFTVARAGVVLEWVGGVQPGVRKLEGGDTRVWCRVRGARPRGKLSWELGDAELDSRLHPVTEWEEETAEGRVWGL